MQRRSTSEHFFRFGRRTSTTLPSTTSDRQRARVKRKNVCKSKAWRDGANLKAHIASRAFPREIPVRGRFFERHFQPLSGRGLFSNQRESISRCPKSLFRQTQNRQIARTSPLISSKALLLHELVTIVFQKLITGPENRNGVYSSLFRAKASGGHSKARETRDGQFLQKFTRFALIAVTLAWLRVCKCPPPRIPVSQSPF